MSTGLECEFVEASPGAWYYILERSNAPKSAFDWREYADAYGPFLSYELAVDHLNKHQANPGAWTTKTYRKGLKVDPIYDALFLEARQRRKDDSLMFSPRRRPRQFQGTFIPKYLRRAKVF